MGLIFGMCFQKSRVFEPYIIRGQFVFQRWVMLKMFMGAMGMGSLCLAVLYPFKKEAIDKARSNWGNGTRGRHFIRGSALGGFILGAGMAVGGACPGMVLSQVGAGVEASGITLAGGLTGAFAYGFFAKFIRGRFTHQQSCCDDKEEADKEVPTDFLDQKVGISFQYLSVGLGIFCIAFAVALEFLFPWEEDLSLNSRNKSGCSWFSCTSWPPTVAGVVLGMLQIPALLIIGTFLGSSSAYMVVTANVFVPVFTKESHREEGGTFAYLAAYTKKHPKVFWQLIYVSSAILGTFLFEHLSDIQFGTVAGLDPVSAFFGGFLMLFGARCAGGCTSGHGISGCAIMMLHSLVAVPAMFAGALAVGFTWQAASGGKFFPDA
jgi:hypothetical protein